MSFLGFNSFRDFPDGPVVKNLLCNAGAVGSIPGQGTKIPHSVEPLSLGAITRERPGVAMKTQHSQKEKKPCTSIVTTSKSAMLQNLGFFVSTNSS